MWVGGFKFIVYRLYIRNGVEVLRRLRMGDGGRVGWQQKRRDPDSCSALFGAFFYFIFFILVRPRGKDGSVGRPD